MTIDEAIEKAREIADEKSSCWKYCCTNDCDICQEHHNQLADWLEELKDYRDKNKLVVKIDCVNSEDFKDMAIKIAKEQYNNALDDFVARLKEHKYTCNFDWEYYDEIAEQLKVGGNNG